MATERKAPDALLVETNLTGAVGQIQDDPDTPDANWLTATAAGATDCRVSFPTPTGTPNVGAGLQTFRAQIRKNSSGGNNCGWSLELWENGATRSVVATGTTTSTTGEVIQLAWNASSLGTADGSLVECRLLQTSGHTGGASNRRYLELGALEWNVDYNNSRNATLSATLGAAAEAATGTATVGAALAGTLAGLTPAATATAVVAAASSPTLGSLGVNATGTVGNAAINADLAATLGGIAGSISGQVPASGLAGAALSSLGASAAGEVPAGANVARALAPVEAAAAGSLPVSATASPGLAAATVNATDGGGGPPPPLPRLYGHPNFKRRRGAA